MGKRHNAETHDGLLMCLYCDFAAKGLMQLKEHSMSEHKKSSYIKAHLCERCGFTTSHWVSLRKDIQREHVEDNGSKNVYDNELIQLRIYPIKINPKAENVQSKMAESNANIIVS